MTAPQVKPTPNATVMKQDYAAQKEIEKDQAQSQVKKREVYLKRLLSMVSKNRGEEKPNEFAQKHYRLELRKIAAHKEAVKEEKMEEENKARNKGLRHEDLKAGDKVHVNSDGEKWTSTFKGFAPKEHQEPKWTNFDDVKKHFGVSDVTSLTKHPKGKNVTAVFHSHDEKQNYHVSPEGPEGSNYWAHGSGNYPHKIKRMNESNENPYAKFISDQTQKMKYSSFARGETVVDEGTMDKHDPVYNGERNKEAAQKGENDPKPKKRSWWKKLRSEEITDEEIAAIIESLSNEELNELFEELVQFDEAGATQTDMEKKSIHAAGQAAAYSKRPNDESKASRAERLKSLSKAKNREHETKLLSTKPLDQTPVVKKVDTLGLGSKLQKNDAVMDKFRKVMKNPREEVESETIDEISGPPVDYVNALARQANDAYHEMVPKRARADWKKRERKHAKIHAKFIQALALHNVNQRPKSERKELIAQARAAARRKRQNM